MVTKTIIDEFLLITKILFEKNFLNLGLGSISLKLDQEKIIINKKNRHIYEDDFLKTIYIRKKDLSWREVSDDVKIHTKIYETISSTKTILSIFPINTITFSLEHHRFLNPIDEIGKQLLGKIPIIEPTEKSWYENREFIISNNMKNNEIIIIKGYGVFIRSRDTREILKKAIILENSATILLKSKQ